MISRWGPVIVVVATVLVMTGGIVLAARIQRTTAAEPGARPTTVATSSTPRPTSRAASSMPRPTTSSSRRPPPRLSSEVTGCRPGQGPATLPAVPQAVGDRVNRGWERIERWLAAHAPATHASLQPPATSQQIADTQRQIGAAIPAELVASLLRHDGTGYNLRTAFTFPPFYNPISTKDITGEVQSLCEVLTSSGDEGSVEGWWHGQYVPFAVDGSGENLFLDQRPGRGGRLGEHDNEGDVSFERWPVTLTELLERTADALETGGTILRHCRAQVTPEGTLDWEILR